MPCVRCAVTLCRSWMETLRATRRSSNYVKRSPRRRLLCNGAGWTMEDAIGWILKAAETDAVAALKERIDRDYDAIDDLIALFKVKTGAGRLKTDYLAYEEVASVIGGLPCCRERVAALLKAVTLACLGQANGSELVEHDEEHSSDASAVFRLVP